MEFSGDTFGCRIKSVYLFPWYLLRPSSILEMIKRSVGDLVIGCETPSGSRSANHLTQST
ncbi:hypothetical protein RBWH47_02829 [Rhodopirellula baltica WH47]|uniref:Uncharacterized protein n=1 Tax=Rhodopirellula baltica WH47 TaxID=991778 RepID=F2AZD6_RHOBT|nr:hypothetical protein RBWH47_02829 [Rhodopirellula baltica WH47]